MSHRPDLSSGGVVDQSIERRSARSLSTADFTSQPARAERRLTGRLGSPDKLASEEGSGYVILPRAVSVAAATADARNLLPAVRTSRQERPSSLHAHRAKSSLPHPAICRAKSQALAPFPPGSVVTLSFSRGGGRGEGFQ